MAAAEGCSSGPAGGRVADFAKRPRDGGRVRQEDVSSLPVRRCGKAVEFVVERGCEPLCVRCLGGEWRIDDIGCAIDNPGPWRSVTRTVFIRTATGRDVTSITRSCIFAGSFAVRRLSSTGVSVSDTVLPRMGLHFLNVTG